MQVVYYYGDDGLKAGMTQTKRDVRFNIGVLKFIEGMTSSYFLIKLLRNDMGIRLREHPRTNWCLHYLFILLRLAVVCFCILYLIPHWAGIEARIFLILEKNEEYHIDYIHKKHSLFNQYLVVTLWTLIFIPTILLVLLMVGYMIVSVTCRPFWQYRQEIRSALHALYRTLVRDFITGYSRHYVLLDEIALEASSFIDARLEEDLSDQHAAKPSYQIQSHSDALLRVQGVVGDMNRRLE
jgi:hypothetical protein